MSDDSMNSKTWQVLASVEKWHSASTHAAGLPPDEVVEVPDNLLVNEGILVLLNLLTGTGAETVFGTGSYIGVGDGTTAAAVGDIDLAGSNKDYQAMETGYPTVAAQTVTWRAIWGSTEGNFAWQEWTVANGNSGSSKNLNRKVASLGTKGSGSSWTLTVTITVS